MRDRDLIARTNHDLEMLLRVAGSLRQALDVAAELAHPLRGTDYDRVVVGGGRSVTWCWQHQREVSRCRRHDLDCCGESVTIGDPTGEAAVMPGRVHLTRQRIEAALTTVHGLIEPLVADVAWLVRTPETTRQARQREQARREVAEDNEARCRSCERTEVAPGVRRAEPVHRRTDGGGVYGEVVPLCSWCYRWVFDMERQPTVEELEQHHRGEKVKRRAS